MYLADLSFRGLALTDILILGALLGYILDKLIDKMGWSKSGKVLREENVDLLRRNTELESTVERHEITIEKQDTQLSMLEERVRELEVRDQKAVLEALRDHEVSAEARYEKTKVGDERRHDEHLDVLRSIASTLQHAEGGV